MNPYENISTSAFWKTAVGLVAPSAISGLSKPKQKIARSEPIGTAGSCFAQHVARELRERGYNLVDVEPPPPILPPERHSEFGFGLFSARYGNIYTAVQLKQLILRATKRFVAVEQVWETDGRFYDPFRPTIEPNGFASAAEVLADQESHLYYLRRLFRQISVFVFTLGLTEAWRSKKDGAVYPLCPGAKPGVGRFDETKYEFVNFNFHEIYRDVTFSFQLLKRLNRRLRFVITVSPVPLTATASGEHVLTATEYSKSVLRAVAGQVAHERDDTSYFPSYEMITAHPFRGKFFEANMRSISADGIAFVMDTFFREFCDEGIQAPPVRKEAADTGQTVCDEEILEFYIGKH